MTTNKIMFKFAKAGINLSPTAYEVVKNCYDNMEYKDEFLDMAIANIKREKYDKHDLTGVSEEDIIKEVLQWEK